MRQRADDERRIARERRKVERTSMQRLADAFVATVGKLVYTEVGREEVKQQAPQAGEPTIIADQIAAMQGGEVRNNQSVLSTEIGETIERIVADRDRGFSRWSTNRAPRLTRQARNLQPGALGTALASICA